MSKSAVTSTVAAHQPGELPKSKSTNLGIRPSESPCKGTVSSITCPRLFVETERRFHSRRLSAQLQDLSEVLHPDRLRVENLLADRSVAQTLDGLEFRGERRRLPVVERRLFVGAPLRDRLALARKPSLGV